MADAIKAVRAVTGLGLKEAKDMLESAPTTVLTRASEEDANEAKSKLEAAGLDVRIEPAVRYVILVSGTPFFPDLTLKLLRKTGISLVDAKSIVKG